MFKEMKKSHTDNSTNVARYICTTKRIISFLPNRPSPMRHSGCVKFNDNTLRNVQHQDFPILNKYSISAKDKLILWEPVEDMEDMESNATKRHIEEELEVKEAMRTQGNASTKKGTHRKNHKASLEQGFSDRKVQKVHRSKNVEKEKRKSNRRRYATDLTTREGGTTENLSGEDSIRPAPRPYIDRSDVSALYDFDENLLDGMGVSNKSDRKFLGEVARCIFRMKNDTHDYVEARISGIDPTEKVLVFSLIYKGSVPLDFAEQQAIKDACGPRFKNIRCVTVPFESEAERRQFQMSCITQIVIDVVKKKFVTQVHHHHHHHI